MVLDSIFPGRTEVGVKPIPQNSRRKTDVTLREVLKQLETFFGTEQPCGPTDPYSFLVWWHCGYPASDAACARGWESLNREVGSGVQELLAVPPANLARALKAGGMVPELRAQRLKEIAARVKDQFGGDLRTAMVGPIAQVRRELKKFPGIADLGADRILLFGGFAPVAAVPSSCPHVVVRLMHGPERENYGLTYREAQRAIEIEVPAKLDARVRAYLLLKRLGRDVCKRTNPKCPQCPVSSSCAFYAGKGRGRSAPA